MPILQPLKKLISNFTNHRYRYGYTLLFVLEYTKFLKRM